MKQIYTAYDHIKNNNIKTCLLVFLFPLMFVLLVFLFTWCVTPIDIAFDTTVKVGIPTFILCIIWMLISWAFGDSMILSGAGATEIKPDTRENKEIFHSVENVALAAGLPTPRVYIINDDSLNAFATGRGPGDATVALTRGIIKKLDKLELEGVIAHEMSHIGNRDIRLDMMIITGLGITVFIADIIFRMAVSGNTRSNDEKGNTTAILWMIWLAFTVFNLIISPILHLAISRKREFLADATAATITRNPQALANALRKITTDSRVECLDQMKSMSALCIAEPGAPRELFGDIFSTHPSPESRIKALESMVTYKQ